MNFNKDPYAMVDMAPLSVGGKEIGQHVVRMWDDETASMRPLDSKACVHDPAAYTLIPNTKAKETAEAVMMQSGLSFEPIKGAVWDGKRYIERWYTRDVAVEMGDAAGSRLALGLQVTNSYNSKLAFGLQFFIMNCVCANQFHGRNLMGGVVFRHVPSSASDSAFDGAVRLLAGKADSFSKLVDRFRPMLSEKPADPLDAVLRERAALGRVWKPDMDAALMAELAAIRGHGERPPRPASSLDTRWGLYNIFTAVATHDVGGVESSAVGAAVTESFIKVDD